MLRFFNMQFSTAMQISTRDVSLLLSLTLSLSFSLTLLSYLPAGYFLLPVFPVTSSSLSYSIAVSLKHSRAAETRRIF